MFILDTKVLSPNIYQKRIKYSFIRNIVHKTFHFTLFFLYYSYEGTDMKNSLLKEISIHAFTEFKLGSAEYPDSNTGCTVILSEAGYPTGIDIRGGAPASRETGLLNPLAANDGVHAIVLSGGSAFGLDTASGVMNFLAERNIGFPTSAGVVPIVCASCLFDLNRNLTQKYPDASLGYQACKNAYNGIFEEGRHGAGTGATIGKIYGPKQASLSALATYAVQLGELKVGAIVAVNAVGNIYDPSSGKILSGIRNLNNGGFIDAEEALYTAILGRNLFHQNTTIGVILTNAKLDKTALTKVTGMAHDGYARVIRPVHTTFDGDSIYAMSSCLVQADINVVGTIAAHVMEKAILKTINFSE